jgi:hypothetical protein
MNVLDENVPESQRTSLRTGHVSVRQIGEDIGRKGMKDDEIIPLLHDQSRPTFFTLDNDFYVRHLCHERYCLVYLDVENHAAAEYLRRFLKHREFNTWAKRHGRVVRISPTGIASWRVREEQQHHYNW